LLNENDREFFPHYLDLSMNKELPTFKEYKYSLSIAERERKSISKYASKFVKDYPKGDYVVQHTLFL